MGVHLITGGAGFIGCNLAAALLRRGARVIAMDDLSRGRPDNLKQAAGLDRLDFFQIDCSDAEAMMKGLEGVDHIDAVWHLAANSDIPAGVADPNVDLRRTFLTTFAVLDVMRRRGVEALHFASSSAIYGDHGERTIFEDMGPLQPISNYGAMKLASEAQIRAAVEAWLPRASIFRFPNVIGVPATHGVMLDFCRKLKASPHLLEVLGDGRQQKSYLHVEDLVSALLHIAGLPGRYEVYNVGPHDEGVSVRFIAEAVRDMAFPAADIVFGCEPRGWIGDVPQVRYSTERLAKTGWTPKMSSIQAVRRAAAEIISQEVAL